MIDRTSAPLARLLASGILLAIASAAAAQPVDPALAAAQQEAAATGRHVLLHFWATWCPPCMRLEHEMLSRPDVQQAIAQHYVLLKVNADEQRHLVERYGVRSLPTDVVLDAQGRVLHQDVSPPGAKYLASIQQIAAAHPAIRPPVAQGPPPAIAQGPLVGVAAPRVAAAPAPAPPPLGLDGYCPVELLEVKRWTPGDRRYGAIHRGRLYLFAGPEQQKRFLANPDRFAPVGSGIDTVLAMETGQQVEGQRRYGAYFDSRVYLFASQETLDRFLARPTQFARAPQGNLR